MLKIYFSSDARYGVDRKFVKSYLQKIWQEKELNSGVLSVVFVGSRKAKKLAKLYLKDDHEHPVITFPLLTKERQFNTEVTEDKLLGEIIVCYPQVTLYAADQDKEINRVIGQFLDHAVTILGNELRKIEKTV
jgi:ssRNA-specific RNase YbeY (16S rRNA maturation enzyme)